MSEKRLDCIRARWRVWDGDEVVGTIRMHHSEQKPRTLRVEAHCGWDGETERFADSDQAHTWIDARWRERG